MSDEFDKLESALSGLEEEGEEYEEPEDLSEEQLEKLKSEATGS